MDIFNVANKQVTQPSVNTSTHVKNQVGQVQNITNSDKAQVANKNVTKQELSATVKHLNEHMSSLDTNITFGFNDKIDTMFVDVVEKSTGRIIRKIPTEEAMKLSEKMKEIVGIIFDKKG